MIRVGFTVEFLLDHLREIARVFFMKKVQLAVDAIDAHIKSLKNEVADLEACYECLPSGATGSSALRIRPLF